MQANLESAKKNLFSNLPEKDDSVVVRFVAVVDSHLLQLQHVHGGGPTHQNLHLKGEVSRDFAMTLPQAPTCPLSMVGGPHTTISTYKNKPHENL
jgi:hypothetical protein